ncbi:MAG: GAF domain-containing protein [Blastocatellia bacterium]
MSVTNEELHGGAPRSEELMEILQKNRTFSQELMAENERLRYRVLQLEKDAMEGSSTSAVELEILRKEKEDLSGKLNFLGQKFSQVEAENKDFAMRFVDIEAQNENLLNLYVASFQLHATLDPEEVLQCVKEILINMIGTEDFGIFMEDEESGDLLLTGFEGECAIEKSRIKPGDGHEGRVLVTGEASYMSEQAGPGDARICIPLKIKERVVGVIAIYELLSHKAGMTALDRELLQLLAGQAAAAFVSSRIYYSTDRRLKTMEGLMKLLKAGK